jgi:transposase-like protein
MPRPGGSAGQRHFKEEQTREEHIRFTSALQEVEDEGASFAEAAQHWNVPKSTLHHRSHGRQPRRQAHGHQQLLTPTEEEELAIWLKEMHSWGLHLHLDLIKARAEAILHEQSSDQLPGVHWIDHFLERHPDMRTALSQRQDVL